MILLIWIGYNKEIVPIGKILKSNQLKHCPIKDYSCSSPMPTRIYERGKDFNDLNWTYLPINQFWCIFYSLSKLKT